MAFDFGYAGVGGLLPQYFAGLLVQAKDDPLVYGIVDYRGDVAVESDFQIALGRSANTGGYEDLVSPNDGTAVAQAWNRGSPLDVCWGPFGGSWRSFFNPLGVTSTKCGPVGVFWSYGF